MKKILAMVLALVMCLSLCACGDASQKDVAGAYVYASGVYDGDAHEGDNLLLHGDFTYDWGSEKGTYKVSRNKILLTNKYSSDVSATLVKQGDFCYVESSFEPIENDYGQTVTFSKEGRIAHEFEWHKVAGSKSIRYSLSLCEDGTFTLKENSYNVSFTNYTSNVREGTYSLENNILVLTAEDITYYFVCTEEGINKEVYKYTVGTVYSTTGEAPVPTIPDA